MIHKGCRLLWRAWDEEYVVYNTGSGDTHLLDMVSGEILKCLEDQASDIAGLVSKSAARLSLEPGPELSKHVSDLLLKLCDVGLIEPAAQ